MASCTSHINAIKHDFNFVVKSFIYVSIQGWKMYCDQYCIAAAKGGYKMLLKWLTLHKFIATDSSHTLTV